MSWLCTQIGAREHYAIPRALARRGRLAGLATDFWATPAWRFAGQRLSPLRSMAARFHADLPNRSVRGFNSTFFRERFFARPAASHEEEFLRHSRLGEQFAERVVRELKRGWPRARIAELLYFGYDTGCLETLRFLKEHGVPCVVDQIDPARVEEELVFQESQRWPGWEKLPGRIPDAYFKRLEEEWRLADRVLVNSDWSKEALIRQGVPAAKLVVVPLSYEAPALPKPPPRTAGELTVLWLGTVNLRKGIQHLIGAANLLRSEPIRFLVRGHLQISAEALATAPPSVRFLGPVSRADLSAAYREADLFVLPTLSDGFAITQLEAMAHGLPVVATPNCGRVVDDGVDGRIVPAGHAPALASVLAELARDRKRLAGMGRAAREKVKLFSLDHLAERLVTLEAELRA